MKQAEQERIHQRLPRGLDHIAVHPDGGPHPIAIGGVDEHPDHGAGGCTAVNDADLEIGEMDAAQLREGLAERGPDGRIEGIDRAIALALRRHRLTIDAHGDSRRGGHRDIGTDLMVDAGHLVGDDLEVVLTPTSGKTHPQFEGGIG